MAGKLPSLTQLSTQEREAIALLRLGIVWAHWNSEVTHNLRTAAKAVCVDAGVHEQNLFELQVPGSFELPLAAKWVMDQHDLDAVICLGCIIKGETDHDVYIAHAVSHALQHLAIQYSKPFVFGVLTVNSIEQAIARSGGSLGNKGEEAAVTALKMCYLKLN